MGRDIAALGCNIELVLISTEGGKAVDVFYVSYEGKKTVGGRAGAEQGAQSHLSFLGAAISRPIL